MVSSAQGCIPGVVFILEQETSALHSFRQQLADAVNARDVARLREQAADGRAAAAETLRAALETSASEAQATAASEIRSLRSTLDSAQQSCAELQALLQRKDAEAAETLRSTSAEMSTLSTALLNLQQAHRYVHAASAGFFFYSFAQRCFARSRKMQRQQSRVIFSFVRRKQLLCGAKGVACARLVSCLFLCFKDALSPTFA